MSGSEQTLAVVAPAETLVNGHADTTQLQHLAEGNSSDGFVESEQTYHGLSEGVQLVEQQMDLEKREMLAEDMVGQVYQQQEQDLQEQGQGLDSAQGQGQGQTAGPVSQPLPQTQLSSVGPVSAAPFQPPQYSTFAPVDQRFQQHPIPVHPSYMQPPPYFNGYDPTGFYPPHPYYPQYSPQQHQGGGRSYSKGYNNQNKQYRRNSNNNNNGYSNGNYSNYYANGNNYNNHDSSNNSSQKELPQPQPQPEPQQQETEQPEQSEQPEQADQPEQNGSDEQKSTTMKTETKMKLGAAPYNYQRNRDRVQNSNYKDQKDYNKEFNNNNSNSNRGRGNYNGGGNRGRGRGRDRNRGRYNRDNNRNVSYYSNTQQPYNGGYDPSGFGNGMDYYSMGYGGNMMGGPYPPPVPGYMGYPPGPPPMLGGYFPQAAAPYPPPMYNIMDQTMMNQMGNGHVGDLSNGVKGMSLNNNYNRYRNQQYENPDDRVVVVVGASGGGKDNANREQRFSEDKQADQLANKSEENGDSIGDDEKGDDEKGGAGEEEEDNNKSKPRIVPGLEPEDDELEKRGKLSKSQAKRLRKKMRDSNTSPKE